jgi:hypothetical protein
MRVVPWGAGSGTRPRQEADRDVCRTRPRVYRSQKVPGQKTPAVRWHDKSEQSSHPGDRGAMTRIDPILTSNVIAAGANDNVFLRSRPAAWPWRLRVPAREQDRGRVRESAGEGLPSLVGIGKALRPPRRLAEQPRRGVTGNDRHVLLERQLTPLFSALYQKSKNRLSLGLWSRPRCAPGVCEWATPSRTSAGPGFSNLDATRIEGMIRWAEFRFCWH